MQFTWPVFPQMKPTLIAWSRRLTEMALRTPLTTLTPPNDGDLLEYDGEVSAWKPAPPAPDASPFPTGAEFGYWGATDPSGWYIEDGRAVSRTVDAALFAVIGTTHGAGDGSTTFNIPDHRGRFGLGKATSGTGSTLGETGGSLDHTHDTKKHYHGVGAGAALTAAGQTLSVSVASGNDSPDHTHTTGGIPAAQLGTTHLVGAGGWYGVSGVGNVASGGASARHKHSVDLSHTHGDSSVTGTTGVVTGGANGNLDQATTATNPAFIAKSYIIKR